MPVTTTPGARALSRKLLDLIYEMVANDKAAMTRRLSAGSIAITIADGEVTAIDITETGTF